MGSAVVFTLLAFSFWYFQVIQHEKYKELAENNHQRTLSLRAPGKAPAKNITSAPRTAGGRVF